MSSDHEQWLSKQGVKIIGQRTLRRASVPRYHHQVINDGEISEAIFETITEQVYQVEMDERTVERLRRSDIMITNAMEHAARLNRQGLVSSGSVGQYFVDNCNRHHELIKENEMYRDAWKEFQTIRVLLGETPHWP